MLAIWNCFCVGFVLVYGIVLWRRWRWYTSTTREIRRYLLEMEKAIEADDEEACCRWASRVDEALEDAKSRLNKFWP